MALRFLPKFIYSLDKEYSLNKFIISSLSPQCHYHGVPVHPEFRFVRVIPPYPPRSIPGLLLFQNLMVCGTRDLAQLRECVPSGQQSLDLGLESWLIA